MQLEPWRAGRLGMFWSTLERHRSESEDQMRARGHSEEPLRRLLMCNVKSGGHDVVRSRPGSSGRVRYIHHILTWNVCIGADIYLASWYFVILHQIAANRGRNQVHDNSMDIHAVEYGQFASFLPEERAKKYSQNRWARSNMTNGKDSCSKWESISISFISKGAALRYSVDYLSVH
jgi:hypothetical protein